MKLLYKYLFLASATACLSSVLYAQDPMTTDQPRTNNSDSDKWVSASWRPSLVKDGVIDRVDHINKAIEWNTIRENDVAWAQRVWREIDVRQKQNQAFIYEGDELTGGGAFIEILNDLIRKGKIQAYSGLDDRFSAPLSQEAFQNAIGGGYDTSYVEDPITGETVQRISKREFNITSVTKYRIKEDWVFDRNLGKLVVRIIGIAPLQDRLDDYGNYRGSVEMYWIYYPEARNELVNYEVYNPVNMVHRMNWTDFLDRRYFSSYIIKTSVNNPLGRILPNGLYGLQEGQEILNDLINRESDMWER